jgi:O-antigen/teichoic acid export membrane protein
MRLDWKNPHLVSVAVQGLTACFGFAGFLLLVRSLEPDEFGVWVLWLTAATLLDMARSGFVQSGLVRYASRSGQEHQLQFVGSGLFLTIAATIVLVACVAAGGLLFGLSDGAWGLFFVWWPVMGIASLPVQFAGWVQQSQSRFDRVLALRTVVNGSFLILLVIWSTQADLSVQSVILLQICSAILGSLVGLGLGWCRLGSLRFVTKSALVKLMRFGFYSTGTLIGANALKSSDVFLIGGLMGALSAGLYSVAQRIIEALEIPLRGLSASLFPELSRLAQNGDLEKLSQTLYRSIGLATIGLIPLSLGIFLGAETIVGLVAGAEYEGAVPVLYLFAVAVLFLPTDRFTGLALDSLERPGLNTAKVVTMVGINVVGDVIAIAAFGTIEAVAVVTCVMMISGAAIGSWLVRSVLLEKGLARRIEFGLPQRLVWKRQ